MKPIVLYSHQLGTNPWKCAIILEELSLPYENRFVEPEDVKKPPFTDLNPNGRVPCIEDPNTGMVLWESVAINEYLVQTYDLSGTLWCPQGPDYFIMKQWLYFQMSGQGPYYGQAGWFVFRHHEYLPSAISRYRQEIRRVIGVLDTALANKEYLVGNKCTIADLAFVTWDNAVADMCEGESFMTTLHEDCPNWSAWRKRLLARPAVQRALQAKAKALQEAGPRIIPKNWEHEKKKDTVAA
ncbi:Glutathione S-transferase 1 [Talaromyces pinophilus]|nr:Glutathione S-transferase 1 [Talaromyces pinophilus]